MGIAHRVYALTFDTTSSNTDWISVACILLEQKHHVMELIIGAVFKVCLGSTSPPEVPFVKWFQGHWQVGHWQFIDQQKYETGMMNNTVLRPLQDIRDSIVEFANSYLEYTVSLFTYIIFNYRSNAKWKSNDFLNFNFFVLCSIPCLALLKFEIVPWLLPSSI